MCLLIGNEEALVMEPRSAVQQVRVYSKVFWERYTELNDFERIIKNIERGEQRIQRQADIMAAIAAKLDRYRNPWQVCTGCSARWLLKATATCEQTGRQEPHANMVVSPVMGPPGVCIHSCSCHT